MKNIILTAALVALAFSASINYAFIAGRLAKVDYTLPQTQQQPEQTSYSQEEVDHLTKLATAKLER